jgi:uncharacterized membrane protein YjfL (UPF0719 family)
MDLALLQTGVIESIIYSIIWILIMWGSFWIFELITKFSTRKELVEDENIAIWVMFAGFFVAVAIIIAAAIK